METDPCWFPFHMGCTATQSETGFMSLCKTSRSFFKHTQNADMSYSPTLISYRSKVKCHRADEIRSILLFSHSLLFLFLLFLFVSLSDYSELLSYLTASCKCFQLMWCRRQEEWAMFWTMLVITRLCNLVIPLVSDVDPLMFEGSRAYGLSVKCGHGRGNLRLRNH